MLTDEQVKVAAQKYRELWEVYRHQPGRKSNHVLDNPEELMAQMDEQQIRMTSYAAEAIEFARKQTADEEPQLIPPGFPGSHYKPYDAFDAADPRHDKPVRTFPKPTKAGGGKEPSIGDACKPALFLVRQADCEEPFVAIYCPTMWKHVLGHWQSREKQIQTKADDEYWPLSELIGP